jgi:hypothetical protein
MIPVLLLQYHIGHPASFLIISHALDEAYFISILPFCPYCLVQLSLVVRYYLVGGRYYMVCTPVILLQFECLQVRKVFFEVQDIIYGGTAEGIDTLGVITHDEYIAGAFIVFEQLTKDGVLQMVGILELIHVQVPELVAIPFNHIVRILLEQPEELIKQIIEVHGARAVAAGYIFFVYVNNIRAPGSPVLLKHFGVLPVQWRRYEITLAQGYSRSHSRGVVNRRIEVHFLDD